MAKGGGMKGTKMRAGGGGMKSTKMRAGGGGMKSTKGMAKGGAAARAERSATGFSNMPASVMSALMGGGTRKAGQANVLKSSKMSAGGGANKGMKGLRSLFKGKRTNTRQQLKKLAKPLKKKK